MFAEVFSEIDHEMNKSMTYDRGIEMTDYKILTEQTEVKVYFPDLRSLWQRGTNENTSGLIR